jgi:hypothetical protein
MKKSKAIVTLIVFTLLSFSILGSTIQCSSQSDASAANDGNPGMELTYFGHLTFTITKQVIIGETPYGIRHNEHYEGEFTGNLVTGSMSGIDYMLYRADGIDQINTRATITTSDDPPAYIGVQITGYVQPDGTMVDSYVRFLTGHEKYKWVNDTVFFGKGGPITSLDDTYEIYYYYYK